MYSDFVVEDWSDSRRREGQVFAAVFPHSDDFTIFAGGTLMKLLKEGAKGYFIRLTNDEKDSFDLSIGETIYRIERETRNVAKLFGIEKVFDFNYKNHYMDYTQLTEIRHRLMILFRHLKVDIVVTFDPWGHYEENPEHYLTGKAVEAASWMAGRQQDLPEMKDMGVMPHFVTEKYYVARGPQLTNRIIDIAPVLALKRKALAMHATPFDNMWRVYLEKHPGGAGRFSRVEEFVEACFIQEFSPPVGELRYYEKFHYIGPPEY